MAKSIHNGWIGVDLDGTLAYYDGWKGPEHIGEPIKTMVDRVKGWLSEGRDVRIFTARVYGGEVSIENGNTDGKTLRDVAQVRGYIEAWCLEHLGVVLPVQNTKDYGTIEIWDDRAYQVICNEGLSVEEKLSAIQAEHDTEKASLSARTEKLESALREIIIIQDEYEEWEMVENMVAVAEEALKP